MVPTQYSEWPPELLSTHEWYEARAIHQGGLTALARVQLLWPWRGCMAIVNWIYHSLDERCMSQRRQNAEVGLRAAMKSGEPVYIIISHFTVS